jgi:hypothetical protein
MEAPSPLEPQQMAALLIAGFKALKSPIWLAI